jgi:erythronate-4-phosphate dehydrogenase
MNITVDKNILFGEEAFGQFGKVTVVDGRNLTNGDLRETHVLIIRSVTKADADLLKGTPVKFVGTTTIGTDHLDKEFLRKNGIAYASAPGCNSFSVAEYVLTAMIEISVEHNFPLEGKTIGIIGVGNIGSKVKRFAEALGLNLRLNDPPLHRAGKLKENVDFTNALSSDIVTFHVPLNLEGTDKTFHLLDENISLMKKDALLINTSRGAVINNKTALNHLTGNETLKTVLDVWENEPEINTELLQNVDLATPHIAGYSLEGKVNGTIAILNELAGFLKTEKRFQPKLPEVEDSVIAVGGDKSFVDLLHQITQRIYEIERDDAALRKITEMNEEERGKYFDGLRKNYPVRREFNNFTIRLEKKESGIVDRLKALRFEVA